jgi:hypothetical protein
MALKTHGITSATPQNLMFSAGAYYKNLKYGQHYEIVASGTEGAKEVVASDASGEKVLLTDVTPTCPDAKVGDFVKQETTGFYGVPLGATSGGGKLTIEPEYLDAEIDGATVLVKGCKNKVGETGSMEINFTEVREGVFIDALHLVKDTSKTYDGYTAYKTKAQIDDDDYLENIAFVGLLNDGRNVIVIMENALCTSAFELEPKNKEQAVYAATFTCHADLKQDDLMHVPVTVLFPTAPTV